MVYEVAFNSARGGYVAIDDISFSPEFCHTETGERVQYYYDQHSGVENPRESPLSWLFSPGLQA